MVPLKYFSNFWRTVEITLTNCETNIVLIWSGKCIIATRIADNQETKFAITGTKRHVPVATLSAQDNAKLLQ